MSKKYKLRAETITDIIETIPFGRVELLMKELTETILQAKMSFDPLKILHPTAKADIAEFVWKDDDKGEISVIHSVVSNKSKIEIMTTKTVLNDTEKP